MNRMIPRMSTAGAGALALVLALGLPLKLQAAPEGAVIAPGALDASSRRQLLRQVARDRKVRSAAFAAVARLRGALPALDRRQRGRIVTVVLPLRALGPAALMPMLTELALDARPRGTLSGRAWRGWRVSLLEAVGSLRDPRSAPVLRAILTGAGHDPVILRAAAAALGRLGRDVDARALIQLVRTRDRATRLAVLPALGQCRRTRVARALAATLRGAGADAATAAAAVAALGQIGNAWAWKTPAVSRTREGEATRKAATGALIAGYPTLDTAARQAAVKALMLIGHPTTHAAIAAAHRKAAGPRARALAELSRHMASRGLLGQ